MTVLLFIPTYINQETHSITLCMYSVESDTEISSLMHPEAFLLSKA